VEKRRPQCVHLKHWKRLPSDGLVKCPYLTHFHPGWGIWYLQLGFGQCGGMNPLRLRFDVVVFVARFDIAAEGKQTTRQVPELMCGLNIRGQLGLRHWEAVLLERLWLGL